MTRWLILSVLIVAATVAVILYAPTVKESYPAKPKEIQGPQAIVTVKEGELTHDFGMMPQLSVGRWQWTLRNDGDADLIIRLLSSTCKCTIADLGKDPDTGETKTATIKPRKEKQITLQWDTKEVTGKFNQSATIGTNDLECPELTFVAKGEVHPAIMSMPSDSQARHGFRHFQRRRDDGLLGVPISRQARFHDRGRLQLQSRLGRRRR